MGHKLNSRDIALYRAVDEVLHYVWDPVGVASVPQARDEYHCYLPQVFRLVHDAGSPEAIAEYLTQITVDHMGLDPRPEHDREIAELLLEWKEVNNRRHA